MHTAIIKFNALSDAIWTTSQNTDFLLLRRNRLVLFFKSGIVIRRRGFKFSSTCVDKFINPVDFFFLSLSGFSVIDPRACILLFLLLALAHCCSERRVLDRMHPSIILPTLLSHISLFFCFWAVLWLYCCLRVRNPLPRLSKKIIAHWHRCQFSFL